MGAHSSLQKAERHRWAHEICNANTYRISQRGLRMHAALGTLLASPGASAHWASGCGAAEAGGCRGCRAQLQPTCHKSRPQHTAARPAAGKVTVVSKRALQRAKAQPALTSGSKHNHLPGLGGGERLHTAQRPATSTFQVIQLLGSRRATQTGLSFLWPRTWQPAGQPSPG